MPVRRSAPLSGWWRLARTIPGPATFANWKTSSNAILVLGDETVAISELQKGTSRGAGAQEGNVVSMEEKQPQTRPDLKEMVRNLKNGAEMEVIAQVLEETAWNRKRAATKLNISYKALLYKIRQYDIRPRQAG